MDSLVCIQDFENRALDILDKNAQNYYKSGSDDEITLSENTLAFSKLLIRPRMLRDISVRNLQKQVLGKPVSFPIGISPTAFQSLAHPQGEIVNAKAAAAMGTIFVLSTFSNWSIEDVAKQSPGGRKWFQLFPTADNDLSRDLITRAENHGYEAIVVTLDAQNFGKKRATMRDQFRFPDNLKIPNLESASPGQGHVSLLVAKLMKQNFTWDTISWIKSITNLPIILKGILSPEDAKLAVDIHVDAIWVSNHGGRQLDTVTPSIDALSQIVDVVKNCCEVYLDSGIRRGSDVFKAMALGATMVFIGRPPIWGIAVAGEAGAKRVLEILTEELDLTMALSGVADVNDITKDYVQRHDQICKL